MKETKLPIRIYFEDTDAMGIVYYANYLKFASRAKAEFFRECGCSLGWESREKHYGFVMRHCEVDYKASARLDDLVDVYTKIKEIKNTSVILEQRVCLGEKELVNIKTVIVNVDENFEASPLPKEFLDKVK